MKKSLLLFVLAILLSNFVYSQTNSDWKWLHPKPQGNTLRYVKAFDASKWYAIGLAGTFMKTTDAGATWTFNHSAGRPFGASGQTSNAYDAEFFDLNNGLIFGSSGGILKTTDAGNTWAEVASNPLLPTSAVSLYQAFVSKYNTIYTVGSSGTILKSVDAGNNWTAIVSGVTTTFNDLWTPHDSLIVIATSLGNVRRSTDAGTTWATVNTGISFTVYKLEFDGTNLMAVGSAGQARVSTDGGATWAAANTGLPATATFYDVDYAGGAWYLTGYSYNLYKSTNLGVSWDTVGILAPVGQQPWTSTYYSTTFSPTADSFVTVGGFGLINSRTGTAAGATPVAHTFLGKPGTSYDVWASGPAGTVIAVGAPTVASVQDQVARSTDGGATWALVPVGTGSPSTFWSIDMLNNTTGFISGTNSAIYKTTNAGATWDSLATIGLPVGATFRKIDFVDANIGWVFCGAPSTLVNFIYKTTDGGINWVAQSHGVTATSSGQVYGANMIDANNGYLCTWAPLPFRTTDGGTTWVAQTTVDAYGGFLYDVKMVDTSFGYMVGGAGRLYKTTNGGLLWDTISVPSRSYTFYSLELINSNTFCIFGSTGVNYNTTDGGATWMIKNTSAATLNGSYYTYDAPTQTHALFTAGSGGAILKNTLSIVPVELASFAANVKDNEVKLNWTTASELNNSGFEVERKSGINEWAKVTFVKGNGTTVKTTEYSYTDKSVKNGKFQYRLKQMDFDGSFTYSPIVEVEIGTPMTFDLSQNYPNPFNPATVISYRIPEASVVSLKIYDVTGTEVMTLVNTKQDAGNYTINFDGKNFASGMYIYTINAGNYTATKKMMLLK